MREVVRLCAPRLAVAGMLTLTACTSTQVRVRQPQAAPPTAGRGLRAGAAEVDITPPPGLPVWGSSVEAEARTRGYHMRLFVRAIALEDRKGERLALVQADLGAMSGLLHRQVAERTADLGLSPDRLLMAVTHTHGAPSGYFGSRFYNGWAAARSGFDAEVLEWLASRTVEALRKAFAELAPARLGATLVRVEDVSRNRARPAWEADFAPSGPPPGLDEVDRGLRLLRIDRVTPEGSVPLAALGVFAVHGTAAGIRQQVVHGDLHAEAAEALRRAIQKGLPPGAVFQAAFLNGAEGDVSPDFVSWPSEKGQSFSEAGRLGRLLAARAAAAFSSIPLTDDVLLRHTYREVAVAGSTSDGPLCPKAMVGVPVMAGARDGRSSFYGLLGIREGPASHPYGCQAPKRKALGFIQDIILPRNAFTLVAPFQVFRIGEILTLATVPGEPTTETGRRILAALNDTVPGGIHAVVAHANEYLGYVATRAEYSLQLYEGGSTLYGPAESAFAVDQLRVLADSLAKTPILDYAPAREFLPGSPKELWGKRGACRSDSWKAANVERSDADLWVFHWQGLAKDENCNLLPVVSIECDGRPLLDADGFPETDRGPRFVAAREGPDRWHATWTSIPQARGRSCRFHVDRPTGPPIASQEFTPP